MLSRIFVLTKWKQVGPTGIERHGGVCITYNILQCYCSTKLPSYLSNLSLSPMFSEVVEFFLTNKKKHFL